MSKKRTLEVVGALIRRGRRILLAQRRAHERYGLRWEFPGGKIESGETPRQAIEREIREELGISVKAGKFIAAYEDEAADLRIIVRLYSCRILNGEPAPLECNAVRWFDPEDIAAADLAPADRKALAGIGKNNSSG